MANTFITPSIVAREALMILSNNLVGASLVHRDHTSEFTGAKVGDTITIRGPATFTTQEFTTSITVQDATESSVPLVLEKHFDVSFAVTAKEKTLNIEDFSSRLIAPAVTAIAQSVDSYLYSKYSEVYNYVGTAGDPPDSVADLAAIDKVMNDNLIPMSMRRGILNAAGKQDFISIANLFQANTRGDSGTALRTASMGEVMGLDWYMAQAIKTHTSGTASGIATPLINGTPVAGATTIDIDGGSGTETLLVGDIINIAGEGNHRVTAANTASGGAFTAIAISPALRANVANDTAVVIPPTHAANLAFHPNAFALCVVPLELPSGVGAGQAAYMSFEGLGIRVVSAYDVDAKKDIMSLDVLCGAKCMDPRLAVRVFG